MIELSGYVPDRDIPIQFTGLRPSEKLYEELLIDSEQTEGNCPTKNFSLLRASARNDDHSVGSRSTEKSDCGKRFGSCLECDVQTGPRVWSSEQSQLLQKRYCKQILNRFELSRFFSIRSGFGPKE